MSEPTSEILDPVQENAPETPIQAAAAKVSVKDLLDSIHKGGKLQILKERKVNLFLPDGDSVVEMTVKVLTKTQYDKLLALNMRSMPEVPMIEQKYTQARRNPLNGEIKPAGSYMEPNPSDPAYIAASQRWFNDAAVLFGLFAAADDFGFDLTLESPELDHHIDEQLSSINKAFPTTTLLDISYEASLVNRGVPIAEQLIAAVESARAARQLEEVDGAFGGTD